MLKQAPRTRGKRCANGLSVSTASDSVWSVRAPAHLSTPALPDAASWQGPARYSDCNLFRARAPWPEVPVPVPHTPRARPPARPAVPSVPPYPAPRRSSRRTLTRVVLHEQCQHGSSRRCARSERMAGAARTSGNAAPPRGDHTDRSAVLEAEPASPSIGRRRYPARLHPLLADRRCTPGAGGTGAGLRQADGRQVVYHRWLARPPSGPPWIRSGQRAAHDLPVGLDAEPAEKRQSALLDEHPCSISRSATISAGRAHPVSAPSHPVHEVEQN